MATAEQLEAALINADKAASAGDQNAVNDARAIAAELKKMRVGSVQGPTSAGNAAAATMEMPITVESAYSKRYNPQQSTLGYVGNEIGKRVAGLLSIPQAATQAVANNPLMGIPSAIARLGMGAADALGIPTVNKAAENLGIEQNLKAPGPMTAGLTGLGLEIGQNFLLPGGTIPQRVLGGIGSFGGGEAGGAVGGKGGEMIGQVLGGVVAPAALTSRASAIKDGVMMAWKNRTPEAIQDLITKNPEMMGRMRADVLEELAKTLRENPDKYAARYAEALDLEKKIPGLKLDIGQKFGAPSIIGREQELARSSDLMLDRAKLAEEANQAALARGLSVSKGTGSRTSAQNIIDRLASDADNAERGLRSSAAAASERAEEIARGANRPADLESIGERALAIRGNEKVAAKATAGNLMQKAGAAAEEEVAKFDLDPVLNRAAAMFKQPIWDDSNVTEVIKKLDSLGIKAGGGELTGRSIPPDLMGAATGAPNLKELPFADIADLRAALNKDIAAAMRSRSENASTQLRNLNIIKKEVDDVIAASPFEKTKAAYGEFIDYYKGEFAPRFLRGVNLLPEKTKLGGDPALPGERVFAEYFKPGGSTNMARYLRLYENNPEAMQLMKDAILDRYSRKVISGDVLSKTAHENFLRDYSAPLEMLKRRGFTFGDILKDSGKAFEEATEASIRMNEAAAAQANDLVQKIVKNKFGAVNAEELANDVLKSPQQMSLLVKKLTQNEAVAFTQFIRDKLGKGFLADGRVGSSEIGKLLADPIKMQSYEILMSQAFGKATAARHVKNLQDIQKAAARIELTPSPHSVTKIESPSLFKDGLQKRTGLSVAVIGNMMRAAITGRVSPEWAAMALGSQAGLTMMGNVKNEVYKAILADPKTAEELLKLMRAPANSPGFANAAKRLVEKVPKVMGMIIGASQYKQLSGQVAGQMAVRTGQEPVMEGQEQ